MPRSTHTYVELDLSESAFREIRDKLKNAGYGHALLDDHTVDMHGIAVTDGDQGALKS